MCGKEVHLARDFLKGIWIFFNWNQTDHLSSKFAYLASRPVQTPAHTTLHIVDGRQGKAETPRAQGRVFQLTTEEAREAPDIAAVMCSLLFFWFIYVAYVIVHVLLCLWIMYLRLCCLNRVRVSLLCHHLLVMVSILCGRPWAGCWESLYLMSIRPPLLTWSEASESWFGVRGGVFLHLLLSGESKGLFCTESASLGSEGLLEVCDR